MKAEQLWDIVLALAAGLLLFGVLLCLCIKAAIQSSRTETSSTRTEFKRLRMEKASRGDS